MASLVLTGDTSGQVTIAAPAVAGTTTLTLPATTGTVLNDATCGVCRAWVNFNGDGTVAIRASFNVTSITDNGTGDYTANFTTAISDANYAYALSGSQVGANWSNINPRDAGFAVGSFRFQTFNGDATPANRDYDLVSVSIFR
jgi:hypothetical protein